MRGISGSKEKGCNAVIVSNKRPDGHGCDFFHELHYYAERRVGADALKKASERGQSIRVFRSSSRLNTFRAHPKEHGPPVVYRYDGLYSVACQGRLEAATPPLFSFALTRNVAGSDPTKHNEIATGDLLQKLLRLDQVSPENIKLSLAYEVLFPDPAENLALFARPIQNLNLSERDPHLELLGSRKQPAARR